MAEITLYKGIAFSPQATLTASIGAADTVIKVSDISAFPPAPNLATIGTDEEGETILYTAKTSDSLSGCQRGVEGTAKAWQAGELIGRNFTAKDHADMIEAIYAALKSGVISFNGRAGNVEPQKGDYTAEQVGAAPETHKHTKSQISDFPSSMTPTTHASSHNSGGSDPIFPANIGAAPVSHNHNINQINDFPSSMPPTSHKHTVSEISDFPSSMTPTSHKHTKSEITDFPSSMTPASHAVNANTYGLGTGAVYGHVKLSDNTNDSSAASSGIAASPKAVKDAYDLAQQALTAAGAAQTYAEGMLKDLFGGTLPNKTLANNSPYVIQRAAHLGMGANFWSVGDKIGITLNGTVEALTFNNETWYAFIIGFNHNSGLEGGNGIDFQFGKNSSGTNIAFVDSWLDTDWSKTAFLMNTTATSAGGWKDSYMRNTICQAFFATLPADWQKIIVSHPKYTDNMGDGKNTASYVTASDDKVFLLSEQEVFGVRKNANSAEQNYQKRYTFYANSSQIVKYAHNATSSACTWWLRSPNVTSNNTFCLVDGSGKANASNALFSRGFAPGFKVA